MLAGAWTILRLTGMRRLRQHRRRTTLTVAGLAVSVCLLIAISAINASLDGSIDAEARGLAGDATLTIAPMGPAGLDGSVLTAVSRAPGVRAAVPVLQELVQLRRGGASSHVLVFGVPSNLSTLFPSGLGAAARQLADPGPRSRGVILTPQLAGSIDARPGVSVELETGRGYRSSRVLSVLAQNPFASLNGGQFALTTLAFAQQVFAQEDTVSAIYVLARPGWSAAELNTSLQRVLAGRGRVQRPDAGAEPYRQTFNSIASIGEQTRMVSMVVAFFLVLSTMSMAFAERREEITLLRIQGAPSIQLVLALLAEAALLGMFASVLGLLGGAVLAHALLQRALESYNILPVTASGPLVIPTGDVLLGFLGGTTVAVASTALAALRVLRVAPIDALRSEAAYEWHAPGTSGFSRSALLAGLGAVGVSALMTWLLPIGESVALAAVALTAALVGMTLLLPSLVPLLTRIAGSILRGGFGLTGRLAAEDVLRTPGRTILATGSLAMTAALVLATGSSIHSYRTETERVATAWYGAPLYVNAEGSAAYATDQPLPRSLAPRLASVPGVKAAYPMRLALVVSHGHQLALAALSIPQAVRSRDRIVEDLAGMSQAELASSLGRGEVVISRLAARQHNLRPGDKLSVPTRYGRVRLRIAGVFDDISSFDSVFLAYGLYARLAGDSTATSFAITVEPGMKIEAVGQGLRRFVDENGIPASVLTRKQMVGYLVDSIQSLFSIAMGVEVAALLVAALIMLNTMLTVTFERRRESGLQRLLGMSRCSLIGSIVLEASAMSAVGAAIAVGLGLWLGFLITFSIENELAWRVAFAPSPALVVGTVWIITVIGALASLYPSWLATRQTVVDLLRIE